MGSPAISINRNKLERFISSAADANTPESKREALDEIVHTLKHAIDVPDTNSRNLIIAMTAYDIAMENEINTLGNRLKAMSAALDSIET
jgi:hypothetical protein